jgi:hypothetical protein
MDKLPFDTTNIDADDAQALEDTYEALKAKFKIAITEDDIIEIKQFDIFSNYNDISVGGTLLIDHPESGCYLTFVKVKTHISNARGLAMDYYKYQVWALATLRNDFGRVVIKRETVVDKILNLVHPTELHFKDDPLFNKKFNTVAGDKVKASGAMTKAFRNILMEIKANDLIIEIVDSTLVIGNIQSIDPRQTIYLAEVASKLSRVK